MEDIEVNTNVIVGQAKAPKNNILFKPTFDKMEMEDHKGLNRTNLNQSSVLNRSSMMTYGKMYFKIF